jgi:hypothetical protein
MAMVWLLTLGSVMGWSQTPAAKSYLPIGLFFGQIEEGARIFTPARLLPFDHPDALGHEFPTLQRLHGSEFAALVWLGAQAGLRLSATLQRYPTEPSSAWPYADFAPPPDTAQLRGAPLVHRPRADAPLPGLRAVLYASRSPVLFLVDTRGLTLAERGMRSPTTMGLDLSRAAFLAALARGSVTAPATGLGAVIYDP